jgi:hypothetical protein
VVEDGGCAKTAHTLNQLRIGSRTTHSHTLAGPDAQGVGGWAPSCNACLRIWFATPTAGFYRRVPDAPRVRSGRASSFSPEMDGKPCAHTELQAVSDPAEHNRDASTVSARGVESSQHTGHARKPQRTSNAVTVATYFITTGGVKERAEVSKSSLRPLHEFRVCPAPNRAAT